MLRMKGDIKMAKTNPHSDNLTAAIPVEDQKDDTPRVRILIPLNADDADETIKVDHYEHVTIGGDTTLVRRGVPVDVTVPVFLQLRNKYPYL